MIDLAMKCGCNYSGKTHDLLPHGTGTYEFVCDGCQEIYSLLGRKERVIFGPLRETMEFHKGVPVEMHEFLERKFSKVRRLSIQQHNESSYLFWAVCTKVPPEWFIDRVMNPAVGVVWKLIYTRDHQDQE